VARRHFEELLKAKQERVRQGPNYPAPNPYTGRHESEAPIATNENGESTQSPETTAPEATYGETHTLARGNQGMRNQK
jgi:hypothetical protein